MKKVTEALKGIVDYGVNKDYVKDQWELTFTHAFKPMQVVLILNVVMMTMVVIALMTTLRMMVMMNDCSSGLFVGTSCTSW